MATVTIDSFRNVLINYSRYRPTIERLRNDISANSHNPDSAIVIVGLDRSLAKRYNESVPESSRMVYQTVADGLTRHVIFNGSSCPKLHDVDGTGVGRLYSSNTVLHIDFGLTTYVLFVKDRTKPVATLPGGTADFHEVTRNATAGTYSVDHVGIAMRELREETTGTVMMDGREVWIEGLDLDETFYGPPILRTKFASTLYGVRDIDATNLIFHVRIGHSSIVKDLCRHLFRWENLGTDGIYRLELGNNPEITQLIAIPLPKSSEFSNDYDGTEKLLRRLPKGVSALCWHATLLSVSHSPGITLDDAVRLSSIGFPPGIRSITTINH